MQNKQRYCGPSQSHVWIANFRGRNRKASTFWKFRISSWSYDMESHAKKCVERYCELANETIQQLYKVSTPCIDDHHFKEEEYEICWRIVKKVCSEIVLKCLYLARIGRPDIICSEEQTVHDRLRNGPKPVTNAWIDWYLPFITHVNMNSIVMWVILQAMQIGIVSRLWLRGRSWRFEIHFWRNIVLFGKSYICSSKLDVPETKFSFTQFNRIRNHLPWTQEVGRYTRAWFMGLIVAVLHGNAYQCNQQRWDPYTNLVRIKPHKLPMRKKIHGMIDDLDNVAFLSWNVNSSRQEALLIFFVEDNEAVIKMMMKGRSPTMRHFSRTHRVALDWLFDRINLNPRIQVKYIDTKNQLAKILHGHNYLWSMMKKSSVSRMQRFMYSQILCYVLERWIRT